MKAGLPLQQQDQQHMQEFKGKSLDTEKVSLKQCKMKQKNKGGGPFDMLLHTLGTNLLENMLKVKMWSELVKQQQKWTKEHTEQQQRVKENQD